MKKQVKKEKKNKEILEKIKKLFNRPEPIIIVLIAIICFMLLYIARYTKNDVIIIGNVKGETISVDMIHCFTNSDMDYFFAGPAMYVGSEKVYSYQIGYYVENEKGDLVEFATRSGKLDKATLLAQIVPEQSDFEIAEANANRFMFTNDVIKNIEKMHFVIKASTVKDSDKVDVKYDIPVTASKLTK